ncbi:MAG TPA: hypothetical protein VFX37_10630 [Pseudolabrys sp.]|nr:hypothetical protein [Pseudolabrys sp.]
MNQAVSYFSFTPSVLRRIRKLVARGMTGRAIAHNLGCSYESLRTICRRHDISLRREVPDLPETIDALQQLQTLRRSGPIRILHVAIGELPGRELEAEARRRGASTQALIAKLLELIVADNLFNAVLD